MAILKRLTPNGELLIPGEFDEQTGIIPGSIDFCTNQFDTGASGKLNVTHANDMNFGTGNFTVEFWFNMRSYFSGYYYSGGQALFFRELTFFKNDNLTIKLIPNLNVNGGDFAYFSYITNAGITSWRLPNWSEYEGTYINKPQLWHHYSLVRYNSAIEMYYDGTKVIQTLGDSRAGSMGQNNEDITLAGSILQIGDITYNGEVNPDPGNISYSPRGGIPGKVTGVRWSKEALHTGNFIPSKSYPTTTANTSLLLAPTGNKNDISSNLILDISGTNKVIVAEQPTGNFHPSFITNTLFSPWSPYVSPQSKVTQDFLYAISFDEVTIHPIADGLAMRETANATMIAGEFDEMSLIGSDIINSSITKNSDFAYVDGQLYRVETFTSNAIITFSENTTVDFLLVGGGQAGANGYSAGVYTTNYYKGNSGRPGEVVEQYSYAVTTDQIYSIEVGNYGTLLSSGDPISLAAKPSKIKFYNGTPIATANAGQIFVDNAKNIKFIGGVLSNSAPGTLVTAAWSSEEYMTDYASDSPGTLSYMTGKPVYYSSHYTTNPTRFIRATGRTATTYGGGGEGGVSNPGFFPSSMGGYGGQGVVIIRYRV